MTEPSSFEINTEWSSVYTVNDQPVTSCRQDIPKNVYSLAIDTDQQYGDTIDDTYHSYRPGSFMTTPEEPVYTHPVTRREFRSSACRHFGNAPLEEAYPSLEAVNPTLRYDPSLRQGILSDTTRNHWEGLVHYQTGPASSIYTAIPEIDTRSFLANTANDLARTGALSHQAYPISTGAEHHQMAQIDDLPLSAQHWPPNSSVHLDAAMWHPAPTERPLSPQPASCQSSRLIQPSIQALGKRKRIGHSEVIEEGTYRFQDDTPVNFDHNGYHGMSPASDVGTTRTASFSGMSTYQNRMGLGYQEGASLNKVIDSDTGGSQAINRSLECNGKIGFCDLQHHWVVRPFETNELLVADFLSQVLSSQPLGWHINWITPTAFAPDWWPRIDRLSNIVHSERQQLYQFLSCFRTYNLDIHQHGTCAIARDEIEVAKGRHKSFKKNALLHTFQKATERDLTDLVKTAELILNSHGIAWKTSEAANDLPTTHPARYFLTQSEFQSSLSGISSVQTSEMARDCSSILPSSSRQGLISCSTEKMTFDVYDSNQVNIAVTKQPRIALAAPLEYTQLAYSNPIMGKQCGGELLACSYRRQEPVQLLTGKHLELFELIYAGQTVGKEIDWNVFAPEFRGMGKGGSRSLGHLVQGEGHKGILLRYMTNCRQIICQTHYHLGTCPILQDQLQKRGLRNIRLKMTGLEDSFQAIRNLAKDVWRGGRPALFEAIEASVTEG